MTSNRARQLKRERQRLRRNQVARDHDTRQMQQQQSIAAARRDWSQKRRRHAIAYVMLGIAALLAVSHAFEHFGMFHLMSAGLEDLLIGWPMAAVLAISGAIIYGT
jgi:uncharacterized membrane protein